MPTVIPLIPIIGQTRFKNSSAELIRATSLSVLFELRKKRPVAVLKLYLQNPHDFVDETVVLSDEAQGPLETRLKPDLESYQREKDALCAINHPLIPKMYHFGNVETTNGQAPYIIMRHFSGENLTDSTKDKPISPSKTRNIAIDVCQALDASHAKGYLHRDIKPHNIIVNKKRSALIDFGLSVHKDKQELDDIVRGTPSYVSPEQTQGKTLDERTDIYSLGATLYCALTGRAPFGDRSAMRQFYAHVNEHVPTEPLDKTTPEPLKKIVLKCLEKDPNARYQSARELAAELSGFDAKPFKATYVRMTQ